MKNLLAVLMIVILPSISIAWGDDYRISRDDALEAESYNRGADSMTRDYDHDGTPNAIDPYDNDFYKDPAWRDYDNDGTPNYYDPYDNDGYKP